MEDPPIPRSLRAEFDLVILEGFSRMIPFSLASSRRLASFEAALDLIPLRCASGIF